MSCFSTGSLILPKSQLFAVRALRIFQLEVSGIFQQNASKLDARWIREDRAAIAIFHENRQPAGVIQMRVCE